MRTRRFAAAAAAAVVAGILFTAVWLTRKDGSGEPAATPARPAQPTPGNAGVAPGLGVVTPAGPAQPTAGEPWVVPEVLMEFVWVEPGSFRMGSTQRQVEQPVHTVQITKGFWMGRYEVTQAEFQAVGGQGHSRFPGAWNPADQVSWEDVVGFCRKLTETERTAGRLPAGYEYRLPTEAEWEYAARGGARSRGYTYAGSNTPDEVAWYSANSGRQTHPVGEKQPNELGLYDMSGNAWEWCLDWADSGYYGRSPPADPVNSQAGGRRVTRGGGWSCDPGYLRSAARTGDSPDVQVVSVGFRACLAPLYDPTSDPSIGGASPASPAAPVTAPPPAGSPPTSGKPWVVPGVGLVLVWIEPGTFQMGASDGAADEKPAHSVQLTKGFWLGKYEVTQEEYQAVTGSKHCTFNGPRNPVEGVSWIGAAGFCRKLTETERAAGGLPAGYEYRLPTEAEWEFAARGGGQGRGFTYAGSNHVDEVAWHAGNSGSRAHPVGEKQPNELGLFDLTGNVWEWCRDCYGAGFYGRASVGSPTVDPENTEAGTFRVARGGCWNSGAGQMRSASRLKVPTEASMANLGFRVCLAPQSETAGRSQPKAGGPWVVPVLGMEFVWIAPGSFQMGSNDGAEEEKPVHAVQLTKGFWLGRYEVTQEEYQAVACSHPSEFSGLRNPVEKVSWNDAVGFCRRLTVRERAAWRLPAGYEYRLPTEAEWEFAARGGTQGQGFTYAGANTPDEVAWYSANTGRRTKPVGLKQPNELGLYDLSGNVWEWCLDWYDPKYYRRSPNVDPLNRQAASDRVVRGGGWLNDAGVLRSTSRFYIRPVDRGTVLGFRACLAPQSEPKAAP